MRTILNGRRALHQGRFEMFHGEWVPCVEKPDRVDHVDAVAAIGLNAVNVLEGFAQVAGH